MAEFIRIYEDKHNPKDIKRVVKIIREGGLVIYPSDTVYALGCDITNTRALERVARRAQPPPEGALPRAGCVEGRRRRERGNWPRDF